MEKQQHVTNFQWDANDYANNSSAQRKWAGELIAKLKLKGSETLLDIGCGDGRITAEIASSLKQGRVMGVDSSDAMIACARDSFPFSTHPNLSFQAGDAAALNFHQQFDVVFSNAALHWVTDHRPVLKGIFQALKPDGRVVVQMGGKGNAARVIEVVNEIMQRAEWKQYFADFSFPYGFFSPDEYTPWLHEAGFEIVRLELKPKAMIHQGREEFSGWFRTTWLPYIARIPTDLKEQFIAQVTENYLDINPPGPEGEISTGMQRLEFVATRS